MIIQLTMELLQKDDIFPINPFKCGALDVFMTYHKIKAVQNTTDNNGSKGSILTIKGNRTEIKLD